MTAANFARLDVARPEVSRLVTAMLQARQAVVQRSWSHPQEDSPMIGGRMCLPIHAPADKREAATTVVL